MALASVVLRTEIPYVVKLLKSSVEIWFSWLVDSALSCKELKLFIWFEVRTPTCAVVKLLILVVDRKDSWDELNCCIALVLNPISPDVVIKFISTDVNPLICDGVKLWYSLVVSAENWSVPRSEIKLLCKAAKVFEVSAAMLPVDIMASWLLFRPKIWEDSKLWTCDVLSELMADVLSTLIW